MPQEENRALVILGMHRSGTSALGGTFHKLGLDFGTNLMPPEEGSNEAGFWEHNSIVPIHERMLRALGSHWSDPAPLPEGWTDRPDVAALAREIVDVLRHDFSHPGDWGMKDPRMCRLLPVWLPLFAEVGARPVFVLISRHPYEVVSSLAKRDGLDRQQSYALWLRYMTEAERYTRGYPRVFVRYEDLLADWHSTIGMCLHKLGVKAHPANPDQAEADITAFLTPSLRHNAADHTRFHAEAPKEVRRLYDVLCQPDLNTRPDRDRLFRRLEEPDGWFGRLLNWAKAI